MSKRKDLTGKVFGSLTVIKYSHNDPGSRSPMWLCKCECGTEKIIHSHALVRGDYKSCGCKRIKRRDEGVRKHIEQDSIDGTRVSSLKSKLHKSNKSGHKGVIWLENRKKWKAYIGFRGRNISLGHYEILEDAIKARKLGEEMYHEPYLQEGNNE